MRGGGGASHTAGPGHPLQVGSAMTQVELQPQQSARRASWLPAVLVLIGASLAGLLLAHAGATAFDARWLLEFRRAGDPAQLAGPGWLAACWRLASWFGNTGPRLVAIMLVLAGFLWWRHWRRALLLAAVLASGQLLVMLLKAAVARPRPEVVAHLAQVHTASYPSGHAASSMLFYLGAALLLAGLLRRAWLRWCLYALAVSLALATGVARVALGVHYPSDVIAGWVIGAAWLWLGFGLARRYWPRVWLDAEAHGGRAAPP